MYVGLGRLFFMFKTTSISSWSLIEEGETFASFTKLAFETKATPISDSVDSVILVGWLITCDKLKEEQKLTRVCAGGSCTRPQLFKAWIAISDGSIFIQWIVQLVSQILIHWIVIYPVDSAIQRLNNRGQKVLWTTGMLNKIPKRFYGTIIFSSYLLLSFGCGLTLPQVPVGDSNFEFAIKLSNI